MPSVPVVSSKKIWNKFHPSLQRSFYADLDCPEDDQDAKIRMQCHKHAVSDIELQKEAIETEIDIEKSQDVPYNGHKLERLKERKIKLINAKRYHQNASNAYWYYFQ